MRCKVFSLLLILSIGLNVLTVSVSAVAHAVSGLFTAVTGIGSVLGVAGQLISDAKVKQAKVEADLETERARNAQLDQETKVSKARLDQQARELDATKRKSAILDAELDATKKKEKKLLGEIAELRRGNIVTYRGNQRLIQHAVSDTVSRVSSRTAIGASRNLAATLGEAVPVAGTAVIVAATAIELKDACAIMQDLHELDVAFNPENDFGPDATEVCGMKVPTADELWQTVKASPGAAWEVARSSTPNIPEIDVNRLKEWLPNISLPW